MLFERLAMLQLNIFIRRCGFTDRLNLVLFQRLDSRACSNHEEQAKQRSNFDIHMASINLILKEAIVASKLTI